MLSLDDCWFHCINHCHENFDTVVGASVDNVSINASSVAVTSATAGSSTPPASAVVDSPLGSSSMCPVLQV